MGKAELTGKLGLWAIAASIGWAEPNVLEQHCSECHNDDDLKGEFSLTDLGTGPTEDNVFFWEDSFDFVASGEMPPVDEVDITETERAALVNFLEDTLRLFHERGQPAPYVPPRRLNNRELTNSIRDVLLIEDVGTHQPTANLLGDTLFAGFDTHGDSLGISEFHIEQYIESLRKVVNGVIFEGAQPAVQRFRVPAQRMEFVGSRGNDRFEDAHRKFDSVDIIDMRKRIYFDNFETVPTSGNYRIKIRGTAIDRAIYDEAATGTYHADPIRLRVHLGDRIRDFDLPDNEVFEIALDEWLVAGTRVQLSYPTDGLRILANGNFKFQFRIAHDYLEKHNPELHARVIRDEVPLAKFRSTAPSHWVHWVNYWQGPRPRLFDAEVEGPYYSEWPATRQQQLLGSEPQVGNAEEILRPIAERAWRREVKRGELAPLVKLVESQAPKLGTIGALKEGIVAVMVSPSFLLLNAPELSPADRFAAKFSYFLQSTTPDAGLRQVAAKDLLKDYAAVRDVVGRKFESGHATPFMEAFPKAWLQLDRINFMAPDPDHFPLFDRKRLSGDMSAEAVRFFRHVVENNLPITEFLEADYSFINADLAKIYDVDGVPQDSVLRHYTFADGRRGGILGMGAFLTLTADSLGTSPIHRAIYVMENLLGIHPNPPPADVVITEPDVRQAKTIKEILAAHTADETCASCHRTIDPYGYAFENFDPQGGWREAYTMQIAKRPGREELQRIAEEDKRLADLGLPPLPKPWLNKPLPIDATEKFRNGESYNNIVEYRQLMKTPTNRHRFVRCFVTKLLTYANGVEPDNYWEIEKLVQRSAEQEYRIIDTIAAVIDSPIFREERLDLPEATAVLAQTPVQ